jgi:hypothetical protein
MLEIEATFRFDEVDDCLARLDAELQHYTTTAFVEDLEDVCT